MERSTLTFQEDYNRGKRFVVVADDTLVSTIPMDTLKLTWFKKLLTGNNECTRAVTA